MRQTKTAQQRATEERDRLKRRHERAKAVLAAALLAVDEAQRESNESEVLLAYAAKHPALAMAVVARDQQPVEAPK